ncbi:SpoIIE family protein phosphatase [Kitasatospora griseola]|uniref:SpoIIE family protein phosphatase n=1 Tax=Kitasatospora griseola TaxID=2064 RepID=UPI003425D8ED
MDGSQVRKAGGRRRTLLAGLDPHTTTLVMLLQTWVDESGLTLDAIAKAFTSEHFGGRRAPRRSAIGERLRGSALDRDFVTALIEVCTPDEQAQARRLKEALAVWRQIEEARTLPVGASPGLAHDLLVRNQQHTIDAQNKLMQAQEALLLSNQALSQSNQLVLMLVHMLNHLNEKYLELLREADNLEQAPSDPKLQESVQHRLETALDLLRKAREEKTRAETEQLEALRLKDVALRRAEALQRELDHFRGTSVADSAVTAEVPERWTIGPTSQDAELADIANALAKATALNDKNEQLTQDVREDLGLDPAPGSGAPSRLSVTASDNLDNPLTATSAASRRPTDHQRRPEQAAQELATTAAIFGQTPTGFFMFDSSLRLQRVNEAFAIGVGLPAEHLLNLAPQDIFKAGDGDRLLLALRTVLSNGDPIDLRLTKPQLAGLASRGSEIWVVSLYRISDAKGLTIGVAGQVQDVTSRHLAEREAAGVRRSLALLNEASTHIGSTLNLETTAEELLDVIVPQFCDVATVDLYTALFGDDSGSVPGPIGPSNDSGELHRVAVSSVVGSVFSAMGTQYGRDRAEVGSTLCYPPRSPHARALRTGRSVVPQPGPDPLLRSTLVVPLVARDQVLGLVQLSRAIGSEPFDAREVAIAEELVARAAVCVDNARLYRREHERALILQRSLLPPGNPAASGLEIARRYLPSNNNTEVGGDWFDVIPLPGSRTALVIGDVMGRGLRATVAMGQLRTVVRTLAMLDLAPKLVLQALDETVCNLADDGSLDGAEVYLATCIYAVYDADTQQCTFASAGHLPPVLRDPNGQTLVLDVPPGLPLGIGGYAYEEVAATLPSGSVLALYTDGLVESRERHLDEGLRAFREVLAHGPSQLDQLCDEVIVELSSYYGEDDVALLMVRIRS